MQLFEFLSVLKAPYGMQLLGGIVEMLKLTVLMFVFGFIWGVVLAVLRALPVRPLRWLIALYVEYHRNVPLVIQIFIWYFGVPQLLPEGVRFWVNKQPIEFLFAFIAMSSAFGAYISEDLRSGIRSMDGRQTEAARALGFSYLSSMFWIVLPQALRSAAPAIMNQALLFFKSTSLAMTIGVVELSYQTRAIQDATYRTFAIYSVTTLIYLAISFMLMKAGARLSKPKWGAGK
ncbi:amino acid ABC transporter permease [Herbaspirillum lusitanum]|uniref:Amino acid ABC transporter permease n=1 Tax=Herbaspirillum lusitanum TaxID=213312 RepID=A0ABW9A5T9_9BURK